MMILGEVPLEWNDCGDPKIASEDYCLDAKSAVLTLVVR
jgi:hypothetical protein